MTETPPAQFRPLLQDVAHDLLYKAATGLLKLQKLTVVFPNRRARLFLNKYLILENQGRPLWMPHYATSSEIFERLASSLGIGLSVVSPQDEVSTIHMLYQSFRSVVAKAKDEAKEEADGDVRISELLDKSFDKFYFLGRTILSDFNDVDMNLVDAHSLFRNFRDLKDLDSANYLSQEQQQAIRDFLCEDFCSCPETQLYRNFLSLWQLLPEIYDDFRSRLSACRLAYAGMLHRMVAEALISGGLPDDLDPESRFAFVGFNALNGCERALMKCLDRRSDTAFFYWDYDSSYFSHQRQDPLRLGFRDDPGTFIRENIGGFSHVGVAQKTNPHFAHLGDELRHLPHDFLSGLASRERTLRVFQCPTDTAMAKYVATYLRQMHSQGIQDDDIAVVLCDESLLPSVLHSIPEEIQNVNITMGFPLMQTPAFSLFSLLVQMRLSFRPGAGFNSLLVQKVLDHYLVRNAASSLSRRILQDRDLNHSLFISSDDVEAAYLCLCDKGADVSAREVELLRALFAFGGSQRGSRQRTDCIGLLSWLEDVFARLASTFTLDYDNLSDENDDVDPSDIKINDLYEESFYQVARMLNHMLSQQRLVSEEERLSESMIQKVMPSLFSAVTVPYSGEPAKGLQIIGFLETRALDFRHLLLLSAGEGVLPRGHSKESLIPYFLKVAHGMPTIELEDALASYYFHRLLHRPLSAVALFNSNPEPVVKKCSGEPSRFLRQLKAEFGAYDKIESLPSLTGHARFSGRISIAKTKEHVEALRQKFDLGTNPGASMLSPSAMISFLRCSLMFFYKYVLDLHQSTPPDEDIDVNMFGTIFHRTMQVVYCEIAGRGPDDDDKADWAVVVSPDSLSRYISVGRNGTSASADSLGSRPSAHLENIVEEALRGEMGIDSSCPLTGIQIYKKMVICRLAARQLRLDQLYAQDGGPFTVYRPEVDVRRIVALDMPDGSGLRISTGGIIDRRDSRDGRLRIVDYKTGSAHNSLNTRDFEPLFSHDVKQLKEKMFQAVLYAYIYSTPPEDDSSANFSAANMEVVSSLFFQKDLSPSYDGVLTIGGGGRGKDRTERSPISVAPGSPLRPEFEARLKLLLGQIFGYGNGETFSECDCDDVCRYCDFIAICNKSVSDKAY